MVKKEANRCERGEHRGQTMKVGAGLCIFLLCVFRVLGGSHLDLAARLDPLIKAHEGKVAIAVQKMGDSVGFTHNADQPMPTASLIKFPIMVEAYYQFQEGKCKPTDMCFLNKDDMVPGAGVLTYHFSPGASFTLRDAIRLMIAYSDNTATNLVLDHIGIRPVNARMEALGLPNTKINSKVYKRSTSSVDLARSEKFGLGSTSPDEMIKLLTLLHDNKLLSPAACKEMTDAMLKCEDPDKFPRFLPSGTKFAMKTGSVSDARTIAGLLYVPKKSDAKNPEYHKVAICIMTADNKDKRYGAESAGDTFIAKCLKEIYDHFKD
jgi:beta-lactamase class A